MPELPEVETVVRGLNKEVKGLTVGKVEHIARHLSKNDPQLSRLSGETILGFTRRGKYIIAELNSGRRLLIHLRMSGRLLVTESKATLGKHDHLSIGFVESDAKLIFRDVRKFGVFKFLDGRDQDVLGRLGVEGPEITEKALMKILKTSKRPIKSFLLDQNQIAGLGNIYVDESLYRAGIHPLTSSAAILPREAQRLAVAIRYVLREAIKHLGTTFDSFQNVNGESGKHSEYLRVYQQTGSHCSKCGGRIKRIKLAGRGTHFCPKCQKLSRRVHRRGK